MTSLSKGIIEEWSKSYDIVDFGSWNGGRHKFKPHDEVYAQHQLLTGSSDRRCMKCDSSKTRIEEEGVTTGSKDLADISATLVTIKNGEGSTQKPIAVPMGGSALQVLPVAQD
jgi:hypothetical protein